MMVAFTRAANLRAAIKDQLYGNSVADFASLVKEQFKKIYQGMLETETDALAAGPTFTVFPNSSARSTYDFSRYWDRKKRGEYLAEATLVEKALGRSIHEVQACSHLCYRAATFSPAQKDSRGHKVSETNNIVQYRLGDVVAAGKIIRIYHLRKLEAPTTADRNTKVILQRYVDLDPEHATFDPYLKWPELGGRLVYSRFLEEEDVVSADDIISHVATCPYESEAIDQPCTIIWPLDRVSP